MSIALKNLTTYKRDLMREIQDKFANLDAVITTRNNNLGILNDNPKKALDVIGDTHFRGNVECDDNINAKSDIECDNKIKASSFDGDGSSIYNLQKYNFKDDTYFHVSMGGTGQRYLEPNKLLVGNGDNGVLTPNKLNWNETNDTFSIDGGTITTNTINTSNIDANDIVINNSIDTQSLEVYKNISLSNVDSSILFNTETGIYYKNGGNNNINETNTAPNGDDFDGYALRFCQKNDENHGFIFENVDGNRLLSIRSSDGNTRCEGNMNIHKQLGMGDNNIRVLQNLEDYNDKQKIALYLDDGTNYGLYVASDGPGNALDTMDAVSGYNFGGFTTRLRVYHENNAGFIVENSGNNRLMSIRGSDASTRIEGDLSIPSDKKIHIGDGPYWIDMSSLGSSQYDNSLALIRNGGNISNRGDRIVMMQNDDVYFYKNVQCENGLDIQNNLFSLANNTSGNKRGQIRFNGNSDDNWGIYTASAGNGNALDGNNCVSGGTFGGFAMRFRSSKDTDQGFIFENAENEMLMSIEGQNGNTEISGNLNISGQLSKSSGTFNIKHPLKHKENTHRLVHSFVEAPKADLIYTGMIELNKGKAYVNMDEAAHMTPGTFSALCRTVRHSTTNEGGFTPIKSSFKNETLFIEAQDKESSDLVFWQIVAERKDQHIMDASITDNEGHLIVEPQIIHT